jgi:signal-transduction protein with cAMP-binding, CBS, and nucleotidyltransferase domain
MRMKETQTLLTATEIEAIKKESEVLTITSDFDIVYENHIPSTGVVLLSGKIELIKGDDRLRIEPHHMLGVKELLNEEPSTYGFRIKADSQVVLIGKSTILNSLKDKKSQLFRLFKECLNARLS